jgi:hypothetical protein
VLHWLMSSAPPHLVGVEAVGCSRGGCDGDVGQRDPACTRGRGAAGRGFIIRDVRPKPVMVCYSGKEFQCVLTLTLKLKQAHMLALSEQAGVSCAAIKALMAALLRAHASS